MLLRKKFVLILMTANLIFYLGMFLLQVCLHTKYPGLKWTSYEKTTIGIVLFFIGYSVFITWLLNTHYPDKYISPRLEAIIISLAVVGCIGVFALLIIAFGYGIIELNYNNDIARDLIFLFRLFSINLFIVALLNLSLIIISFKLNAFITKEYSKSIVNTIKAIGKN